MARVQREKVLKIDRPFRAGGFVSLTALWAEGCGGGFAIGHTYGVRVQKVQRVQRVVVAAPPQIKKEALCVTGTA